MSFQKSKNESNEKVNHLELAHQFPNKINNSKSPLSPHFLNGTPNCNQNVNTNTSEVNRNHVKRKGIYLNLKINKVKHKIKSRRF